MRLVVSCRWAFINFLRGPSCMAWTQTEKLVVCTIFKIYIMHIFSANENVFFVHFANFLVWICVRLLNTVFSLRSTQDCLYLYVAYVFEILAYMPDIHGYLF
jgi:hypothetical protein